MTTNRPHPARRPNKIGNGFRATVIAFSLMSFVVAWDLVARRDAAKAVSESATPLAKAIEQPTATATVPATPWPTLAPLPGLAPLPTLPPLPEAVSTGGMAQVELPEAQAPVVSLSIAAPPALPTMPTMAPLPAMPAPPPPPPSGSGGGGGGGKGGGGGGGRSGGS